MNFNIYTKNIEATDKLKGYFQDAIRNKVGKVADLEDDSVIISTEASKTKSQKSGEDLYHAEISLEISGKKYYSSEETDNIYKSIDEVCSEVLRMIKKDATREAKLRKKGGKIIKDMLRKKYD